jgi:sugar lactone lactonase YvrE
MDIALDAGEGIQWPFNWYFRDQKKLTYFNPPATGQPVVIAGTPAIVIATTETKNDAGFQQFVQGKYREEHYVLRWWFPEDDYKNPNFPSTFVSDLFNIGNWNVASRAGKYLLYRDPGAPLGSTDFYLYTRNDLVSAMGNPVGGTGSAGSTGTTTNPNPNVTYGLFDMAPQGNANGQFNQPRGIALAPDGTYYVVDTTNRRVQHFDATGKFLNAFGSEGNGQGQFTGLDINGPIAGTGPGGIAVDKQGNVYVADTWNHRVQKFDSKGTFLTMWGSFFDLNPPQGGQAPAAPGDANLRFYGPRGVAIGSDGTVYVTDTGNKRVLAFDPNGKPLRQIGAGPGQTTSAWNGPDQLNEPMGIALDAQDNIYVADTFNTRIQVFDKNGQALRRWTLPSGSWDRNTAFLEPSLALGADGNLYATDPAKQSVVKMDLTGKVLGSKTDGGKAGSLVRPTGLAVTAKNEVIVVDTEKNGVINMGTIP